METRCCKALFPNNNKKRTPEDSLIPPLREKLEKKMFVFILFSSRGLRGGTFASTSKIANTLTKNSSRDDRPSISTQNQPTANSIRVGQGQ